MKKQLCVDENGKIVHALTLNPEFQGIDSVNIFYLGQGFRVIDVSDEDWLLGKSSVSSDDYYYAEFDMVRRPDRPTALHEWNWLTHEWSIGNSTMEHKREELSKVVDSIRDRKNLLPIDVDGVVFDADSHSIQNIEGVVRRILRGDGLPSGWQGWRTFDNSMIWVDSTPEHVLSGLNDVARAIENRRQSIFSAAWLKKAEISSLDSAESILGYDPQSGWPD